MRIPVIGITMSCDTEEKNYYSKNAYAESIVRAGGLPLLIPADGAGVRAAEYAERIDGLLLAGGGDIHPVYFGEEPMDGFAMGELQPRRDKFELSLCREAERRRLPMLGICRGIQLMAVAAGGSIWQDIDSCAERTLRIRHMQKAPDWCETHSVHMVPETKLAQIYGLERILVNSFHHQAVKRVPAGYRVCARGQDGIIEAMEADSLPFAVGVQWHPERLTAGDAGTAELFGSLVRFSGEQGRTKQEKA